MGRVILTFQAWKTGRTEVTEMGEEGGAGLEECDGFPFAHWM